MSGSALKISQLQVHYGDRIALDALDLEIESGELVAVIGPNGSGKSTLLKAILGLIHFHGRIQKGKSVAGTKLETSYLPQSSKLDLSFPMNVSDVIKTGGWRKHLFGLPNQNNDSFDYLVGELDLKPLLNNRLDQLSGGQLQRVLLARTLIDDSEIILLDEPLNAVDINSAQKIVTLLKNLQKQGKTILITTHDLSITEELASKVLFVNKKLIAYGSASELDCKDAMLKTFGESVVYDPETERFTLTEHHH